MRLSQTQSRIGPVRLGNSTTATCNRCPWHARGLTANHLVRILAFEELISPQIENQTYATS